MCRLIVFAIFFINYAHATRTPASVQSECIHANEQYYDNRMSPICDRNCQDLNRECQLTTMHAVAGCYCRPGYARNLQQQCITLQQCASDCFPNEYPISQTAQHNACEHVCHGELSARTSNRQRLCYRGAERKCICKSGYCRNQRAQCVLESSN